MLLTIFKRSLINSSNIGLMRTRFCTFTTVLKIPTYIYVLVLSMLFSRCAQIGTLSGGAKDTTPPKVIKALPFELSTDVKSGVFVFEFDEVVVIKDPGQFFISPQTSTKPELEITGKRLKVTLVATELLPNTTYRMNFGSAIADLHEGNGMTGYTYVFSTGTTIDSLELTGQLSDAVTNGNVVDALVGLQLPGGDSLMYKKPLYVTRVDSKGSYQFQNLPRTSFYMYAFTDNNRNGLYDGESERIAFSSKQVEVGKDSSVSMRLFRELAPRTFLKKTIQPVRGQLQLVLNQEGDAVIQPLDANIGKRWRCEETSNDTVTVYYYGKGDTLRWLTRFEKSGEVDTLEVALPPVRKGALIRGIKTQLTPFSEKVPQAVTIMFPVWMDTASLNLSKLHLMRAKDSTQVKVRCRWKDVRTLTIQLPIEAPQRYQLKTDTAFVLSMDSVVTEPLNTSFKVEEAADFGTLTINLVLAKKKHYIVQLINDADGVIREEKVQVALSASARQPFVFKSLPPGNYRLRVIADDNKNGKWDTGQALKQVQPEEIFTSTKIFNVLADWEAEEEIKCPL